LEERSQSAGSLPKIRNYAQVRGRQISAVPSSAQIVRFTEQKLENQFIEVREMGVVSSLPFGNPLQNIISLHFQEMEHVDEDPVLGEFITVAAVHIDDAHVCCGIVLRTPARA